MLYEVITLVMRPSVAKTREAADRQLIAAGYEGLLSGREFIAIKMLMPVICGAFWFSFLRLLAALDPASELARNSELALLLGIAVFYYYPLLWLRRVLKSRHAAIQKALPFVLDVITSYSIHYTKLYDTRAHLHQLTRWVLRTAPSDRLASASA